MIEVTAAAAALAAAKLAVEHIRTRIERHESDRDTQARFAEALGDLAGALATVGELSESEAALAEAREIAIATGNKRMEAVTVSNLGAVLAARGELDSALEAFERASGLLEESGDAGPLVLSNRVNLAAILDELGRPNEATAVLKQVVAAQLEQLGRRHPDTLSTEFNLGMILVRDGRFDEAEPLLRSVLSDQVEILGNDHPDVARTLSALADIRRASGDLSFSAQLLERSLDIYESVYGRQHHQVASALERIAELRIESLELDAAESLLRQAQEIYEAIYGADHPRLASIFLNQRKVERLRGNDEVADRLLHDAHNIYLTSYGSNHPATLAASAELDSSVHLTPHEAAVRLDELRSSESPRVRQAAVRGLSALQSPESVLALQASLFDESVFVRQEAVRGLANSAHLGGLTALSVATQDPSARVRRVLARELARISDPEATAMLRDLSSDFSDSVRQAVVAALCRQAAPDDSLLESFAEDPSAKVRKALATELGRHPTEGVVSLLGRLGRDHVDEVAAAAHRSTERLQSARGAGSVDNESAGPVPQPAKRDDQWPTEGENPLQEFAAHIELAMPAQDVSLLATLDPGLGETLLSAESLRDFQIAELDIPGMWRRAVSINGKTAVCVRVDFDAVALSLEGPATVRIRGLAVVDWSNVVGPPSNDADVILGRTFLADNDVEVRMRHEAGGISIAVTPAARSGSDRRTGERRQLIDLGIVSTTNDRRSAGRRAEDPHLPIRWSGDGEDDDQSSPTLPNDST